MVVSLLQVFVQYYRLIIISQYSITRFQFCRACTFFPLFLIKVKETGGIMSCSVALYKTRFQRRLKIRTCAWFYRFTWTRLFPGFPWLGESKRWERGRLIINTPGITRLAKNYRLWNENYLEWQIAERDDCWQGWRWRPKNVPKQIF